MAGVHGRSRELSEVHAAMAKGRSVVITGEAGIGKSAVWREALAGEPAERRVLRAVATATTRPIPFGALAPYLPRTTDDPLGLLLEALATFRGGRGGPAEAPQRPVLAVDDAHLLDDHSAALVGQVVEQGLATALVTLRTGEAAPSSIEALAKEDLADVVMLRPLDADAAAALVEDLIGGLVEPRTNARLLEASGGRPLFLRELVLRGLEEGSLVDVGGVTTWTGELRGGPTLNEVLTERLTALDAEVRQCAQTVAITGPLPAGVLERLCSPLAVSAALSAGVLRPGSGPGRTIIEPGHPLYGAVLLAAVPPSERHRVLMAAVAVAEQRGVREPADAVRLASWLVALADRSHPEVLLAAAERAFDATDVQLAARLADAAVEAGAGPAASLLRQRANTVLGRRDPVGAAPAEDDGDEPVLTQQAMAAADRFFFGFGPSSAALASIASARAELPPGRASDELAAVALAVELNAGTSAAAVLRKVDALLAGNPHPAAIVRAALAGGPAAVVLGRTARALEWLEHATEIGPRSGCSPFVAHQVEATLAQAYIHAGRLDDAEHLVITRQAEAIARDDVAARTGWAIAAGQVQLWRGRPRRAARQFGEALALLRGIDLIGYGARCRADLAYALAWAGEPAARGEGAVPGEPAAAGTARSSEGATRGEGLRLPDLGAHGAFFAPLILISLAERDAALGRLGPAGARATTAAARALEMDQPAIAALALHVAVRVRPAKRTAARLRGLVTWRDDDLASLCAQAATAIADDDGAALESAAAQWEKSGASALASETYSRAAAAYGRAGLPAAARRCRVAALDRVQELEAPPPLAELASSGPRLTLREREVAGLAAIGLTNNEIASRLGVSVRTVHTHLQVAYQKLGVNRRDLLGPLLRGR